jgi:hypothetical protein
MNDPCTDSKGKPKKRWATEKAARFVADYVRDVEGFDDQMVYKCGVCNGWHTTRNKYLPRSVREGSPLIPK